jgi:hypothetical protein
LSGVGGEVVGGLEEETLDASCSGGRAGVGEVEVELEEELGVGAAGGLKLVPNYDHVIANIPTRKTTDFDELCVALRYRLHYVDDLYNFCYH